MVAEGLRRGNMLDLRFDFLRFRSGRLGRTLRRCVHRALVGRESWPVEFRAPSEKQLGMLAPSAHLYFHIPFCLSICSHCP